MQLCASVSKTINHNLVDLDREIPGMNGYDNTVEVEWDEEEGCVILEGEQMAREATNMNKHDWLINQSLDELLGYGKFSIEAHPECGALKTQFDFDNNSQQTFNFVADSPKAMNGNKADDKDKQQKPEAAGNWKSMMSMVLHFNMAPDKINPVPQFH